MQGQQICLNLRDYVITRKMCKSPKLWLISVFIHVTVTWIHSDDSFYMGHSSCCPRMLFFTSMIVILVSKNTCTSDKVACLILQVLLFAVVCYSASTQIEPTCMLTTDVCNAWIFCRLCRIIVVLRNKMDAPLFFYTRLRIVQYTV